jgi:hypothetical protein
MEAAVRRRLPDRLRAEPVNGFEDDVKLTIWGMAFFPDACGLGRTKWASDGKHHARAALTA